MFETQPSASLHPLGVRATQGDAMTDHFSRDPNCIHPPMAIEYRSASALVAYKANARTHSKAQIRKIAESIHGFGFTNPVLVDRNDTIIAGHGRVEAAKLLKLESVPTIRLEALTPAQVRAYVIADNRLAEDAGWDKDILKIELQHILLEA